MKIGNLVLPDGAGLAPMAGVTDMPFRRLCAEQGAAWTVSEMLSAKGFLCAPENARAVRELIERAPDEPPGGLQLFGREPELFAEAARRLEGAGFSFIDINMGCPAHKIVGGGEGSYLMREPELAGRIIRATAKATRLPVTVKLRAGWDAESVNAPLLSRIAEDNGARAVAVHPRTRDQFYAGRADWSVIEKVVRAVSIPVIGNGDIRSGADAARMLGETGCAGVLIGRAAQGNPWIFAEVARAFKGEAFAPPTMRERAKMALRHLDAMRAWKGDGSAVMEMRKHVAWYLREGRGCAKLRARVNSITDANALREELIRYAETCEGDGTLS